MSEQDNRPGPDPRPPVPLTPFDVRKLWGQERREKVVQEILANRRGEYRVPTWVLFLALVLMIAAVVTFIALS